VAVRPQSNIQAKWKIPIRLVIENAKTALPTATAREERSPSRRPPNARTIGKIFQAANPLSAPSTRMISPITSRKGIVRRLFKNMKG
jgi:hypothetical protein